MWPYMAVEVEGSPQYPGRISSWTDTHFEGLSLWLIGQQIKLLRSTKIGKNLRDEGLSYDFQCSFKRPLRVGNLSVKIREVKIRALQ